MICVRFDGGLGNQLFQYSAGRALAHNLGVELLLDTSVLQRQTRNVTRRRLELSRFSHVGRYATKTESYVLPWLHHVAYFSHLLSPWHTYVERSTEFDANVKKLSDQTYLVGYWQSHHYFSGIANQLTAEFLPIDPCSPKSMEISEAIDVNASIALHVRRGDYVSLKSAASFHGALPLSYYMAAVTRVRECVANPKFFVFSDDPEWCRSNLQLGDSAVFVDHNLGADSWQDLVLMGRCRHHVIANSSFSWWGAWLADQRWGVQQRLVIAPARWFSGRAEAAGSDRFPAHWEVLS